jgi:hypothetical protein
MKELAAEDASKKLPFCIGLPRYNVDHADLPVFSPGQLLIESSGKWKGPPEGDR